MIHVLGLVHVDTEYLRAPIPVRVSLPILANNAGGAGYFGADDAATTPNPAIDSDDGFVSMEEIAAGFLETLKRSNFNAGKSTNSTATSTEFTLDKIVRPSDNMMSDNAWTTATSPTIIRQYQPL